MLLASTQEFCMWACALFSSLRCCVSNSALLLTVAMRCEMMVSYPCRASQFSTYCCVNECGEFRDDAVPTRTPAVASLGGAPLGTASAAFRDLKVKRLFRESNDGHGLTVPSCTIVKSWNEANQTAQPKSQPIEEEGKGVVRRRIVVGIRKEAECQVENPN